MIASVATSSQVTTLGVVLILTGTGNALLLLFAMHRATAGAVAPAADPWLGTGRCTQPPFLPYSRPLPDQRWLDLVLTPDGEARISVAPDVFTETPTVVYFWRNLDDALEAFEQWSGLGEPMGWYRREPDDR